MPGNRNVLHLVLGALIVGALTVLAGPVFADQVAREQDIVALRLGQRVLVDDGSCPAGQIKEVSGSRLNTSGVVRVRKCIQRLKR
jgi:hypothetical protein